MSYHALIADKVKLAFTMIGDLAVDIVLSQTKTTSFNFGTLAAVKTTPVVSTVKGVITKIDRKRASGERLTIAETNTVSVKLTFLEVDVVDLTNYDTATIAGVVWNLVGPYENNGFTVSVTATKESHG